MDQIEGETQEIKKNLQRKANSLLSTYHLLGRQGKVGIRHSGLYATAPCAKLAMGWALHRPKKLDSKILI